MTGHGDRMRGAALVALAALLWSSSGLFIKVLPLGALQIAFARSLVAALTIALVVKLRGGRPFPRPDALAFACAAAYAGVLIFFVAATKLTTAANAIFLQFSAPIYLVFLEPRLAGRPVARRDLLAVILCLGAMGLFFVGRLGAGTLAGNLLGVVSGLCLALFSMTLKLQRERRPEVDPIGAIILGNLLVAAVCAPALPGLRVTLPQAGILLYLGVFQIGIAYLLFNAGMKHLSATAAVVTGTLEAVLNPVWVFLGIGERPSAWALLGGLLILGTIIWYSLPPRPSGRRSARL
ncbi:membrane protein [Geothrix oryzae]|jgi:drug/metabolite transporter (DMT)-like permease|uniref:Membrane protein n=1 Tax=Geothrix oryzae TaxID=2927975 RepID=A0ABN6UZN1_9BACT|nr:EamA family transporter [Geothrix oryzae]BDU70106.1 membrane protein [Geothrix oryzae]